MNGNGLQPWMLDWLGGRVQLLDPVGQYPKGRTGILVSLQAGVEPGAHGPYATVGFSLGDWSDEENVPLRSLWPVAFGR